MRSALVRPVAVLFVVAAACAAVAGALGWALGSTGAVFLVEPLASRVPPDRHAAYLADLWAHSASYLVGLVGGMVLIVGVWRSRGRAAG